MLVSSLSRKTLNLGKSARAGSIVKLATAIRSFSSDNVLVTTSVNKDTGVATLTMNQAPVNSLSMEM